MKNEVVSWEVLAFYFTLVVLIVFLTNLTVLAICIVVI